MCKKNNAIWLSFALFFPLVFQAQVFVTDSFADGNFTSSPPWFGDSSKFEVNPSNQLQLNDTSNNSPAYLVTSSNIINQASWEFWLRMEFAPSGSNYGIVYLVSDNQNLTQNLNGYFVQIGGVSGTVDDVSLYRQDGSSSTKLIDGIDGTVGLDPVDVKVKVTKDSLGEWELFIDTSAAKNNYVSQGTATDLSHPQSSYFGVLCTYTSTRSDKFFFDDISLQGEAFQDTIKPILNSLIVIDNNSLQLNFSEKVQFNSALSPSNYLVNKGFGSPQTVSFIGNDSSLVRLDFSNSFTNAEAYFLKVENVSDRSSNVMEADSLPFLYFQLAPATYRDVVINEFYPDFTPSLGLPSAEFVEIYNASSKVFDLANWSLTDGTSSTSLISYILRPGDYLILCAQADENDFTSYGDVLGVSSLPTLNNSGDLIRISDANNQVIDELSYDESWYQDENKTSGGWTIEQINPFAICTGISNFGASTANIGGTPGVQNSIFDTLPDTSPPELLRVEVLSVDSILLFFNERLDTNSVLTATYSFNSQVTINQIFNHPPDFSTILLTLSDGLDSGLVCTLTVNDIRDCPGNLIEVNTKLELILPEVAARRDIVINEILFNPRSGGSDFVELYNRSNKIISLQNWQLGNEDNGQINTISEQPYLLFPGEYVFITANGNNIREEYPDTKMDRLLEVEQFASFNNDEGIPFVVNAEGVRIDEVSYHEDMHFELLRDVKGVSLERINPHGASDDASNFHSAAEAVNFATPGYQNSQYSLSTAFKGAVNIDPETFSPDNDGYQDLLNINYQFEKPGNVANVRIYDRKGRLIRDLVNNELLGLKGTIKWDGITTDNNKARIGVYVIYFEIFNPNGDQKVYKESAVLAGFLD